MTECESGNTERGLIERLPSNIRSHHLTYLRQDDFSSSPKSSDTNVPLLFCDIKAQC